MSIAVFGQAKDGREVQAITLQAGDLTARVLTLGAVLQDVRLAGVAHALTIGGNSVAAYEGPMGYCGAVVGPVANRIDGARAVIAGKTCSFAENEGPGLTLHGGPTGTGGQNWRIEKHSDAALTLATDLPDGLGGFPGNRVLRAEFTLAAPAELVLKLTATTDAPTLMNLTNHSYWNMDGTDTTAGQIFRAAADEYLPLTARRIPTGEVADVTGTVFDFRKGRVMEARETYDMCLVFARARRAVTDIAEMIGQSGVRLRLATTEPGLQIYDMARFTSDPFVGHQGRPYPRFAGLALETHAWPDAPNHPHFPSILLQPGELLEQVTRFRFDRA